MEPVSRRPTVRRAWCALIEYPTARRRCVAVNGHNRRECSLSRDPRGLPGHQPPLSLAPFPHVEKQNGIAQMRLPFRALECDLGAAPHDGRVPEWDHLGVRELDAEIASVIARVPNELEKTRFRVGRPARVGVGEVIGQEELQGFDILPRHRHDAPRFEGQNLIHSTSSPSIQTAPSGANPFYIVKASSADDMRPLGSTAAFDHHGRMIANGGPAVALFDHVIRATCCAPSSPREYFEWFRHTFGPMVAIYASLGDHGARIAELDAAFKEFITRWNRGVADGSAQIPYEYLLVIARKAC